jgi:hypothetical protein
LPDGTSRIFFAQGLDTFSENLPDGQISQAFARLLLDASHLDGIGTGNRTALSRTMKRQRIIAAHFHAKGSDERSQHRKPMAGLTV